MKIENGGGERPEVWKNSLCNYSWHGGKGWEMDRECSAETESVCDSQRWWRGTDTLTDKVNSVNEKAVLSHKHTHTLYALSTLCHSHLFVRLGIACGSMEEEVMNGGINIWAGWPKYRRASQSTSDATVFFKGKQQVGGVYCFQCVRSLWNWYAFTLKSSVPLHFQMAV